MLHRAHDYTGDGFPDVVVSEGRSFVMYVNPGKELRRWDRYPAFANTAEVVAFSDDVVPCTLNPRDSVMTNAKKLASLPSGGTDCSAPLRHLNAQREKGDLVLMVSDNMSWMNSQGGGRSTATMEEWAKFRARNPRARLVCLDIQPYASTQAAERADILNVGGFSDVVFEIIANFASGELNPDHWVGLIEKIEL